MSELTIGELFSGYGGLGMGVQAALGVPSRIAWHSDIDPGACKVLAHRYPDVPNLGDVTTVDWSTVERVDVLTGGSPCQDLSHAGKRAGMTDGTRSNLWVAMREAIAQLRPPLVIWENVRGAMSAPADSELGSDPRLLDRVRPPRGGQPVLRALGRVLGDLADLGYDAAWHGLRAADVGAPHGRWRVFVAAWPAADAHHEGRGSIGRLDTVGRDADRRGGADRSGAAGGSEARDGLTLLPSPRTSDTNGAGVHGDGGLDLRTAVTLLPSPKARDYKAAGPSDAARHDPNLSAVSYLLPTPRSAADRTSRSAATHRDSMSAPSLGQAVEIAQGVLPREFDSWDGNGHARNLGAEAQRWGKYAAAVARWEPIVGPAPSPTEPGRTGAPRLAAQFAEWMMGLPAGWITDVPGVTRNEALKLAGNGVVPQQAEAAVRLLLPRRAMAVAS